MYLVNVHAQVSGVTEPLLDRTLNALVEDLAEEALRCFRQVKRFGMGGMLRVSFVLLAPYCSYKNHHAYSLPFRLLLKLSSCTKRYHAMLRHPLQKHSQICTTRSHKPTPADLEMRISKAIWTVSRRLLRRPVERLGLNSCVSGRQRKGLVLLVRGRRRVAGVSERSDKINRV